jgi:hypothetical protein
MFSKLENWVLAGGHPVSAMLVYLSIALLLYATTLNGDAILATGSGGCTHQEEQILEDGSTTMVEVEGCGSGQQCCNGVCIDEDDICCDDGTYGNSNTCSCCDNTLSCSPSL